MDQHVGQVLGVSSWVSHLPGIRAARWATLFVDHVEIRCWNERGKYLSVDQGNECLV